MRRAVAVALALCLLAVVVPRPAAADPNDLFLFFDLTYDVSEYTNGSTVEAWAALNFTGNPDPPVQVDNIEFRWYAPNGTLAATDSIDPDPNGWALSAHRAMTLGAWAVNATYLGTPALSRNRTFLVLPESWSGTVVLTGGTMVGGNATLAVAPGTTIRCDPGVNLRVKGNVSAVGTPAQPILITANASAPSRGAWSSVIFHRESGSRSAFEQVRIQYPESGVRLVGSSPRLENVSVADALENGFQVTDTQARLVEVGVSRAPNGFRIEGSNVTVENATVRDVSSGVFALGGDVVLRNATITNALQFGIYGADAALDLAGVTFDGAAVALSVVGGTVRGDGLSFRAATDGFHADSGAAATIGNSTFGGAVARDFLVTNGARVAVVNGTFPLAGESASVSSGSDLTLWNYLGIRVLDHDAGDANLTGASVTVYSEEAPVFAGATDANGTVPTQLLLYRRYAPTLSEAAVRVVVTLTGYAFEDNNRTLRMETGRAERFRGSTADLDGDGEPDFSDADIDGDGLSNDAEAILGTDPRNPDTDGDGLPDEWEFDHQLDPKDPADAGLDSDLDGPDGLNNTQEYEHGTDPRTSDTDMDGLPDGWEVRYGFDPLNASDAEQDPDGDGYTNLEEYRGGTDPRDPSSHPVPGASNVWLFAVAVLTAIAILVLSFVLLRRRRGKTQAPPPEGE